MMQQFDDNRFVLNGLQKDKRYAINMQTTLQVTTVCIFFFFFCVFDFSREIKVMVIKYGINVGPG